MTSASFPGARSLDTDPSHLFARQTPPKSKEAIRPQELQRNRSEVSPSLILSRSMTIAKLPFFRTPTRGRTISSQHASAMVSASSRDNPSRSHNTQSNRVLSRGLVGKTRRIREALLSFRSSQDMRSDPSPRPQIDSSPRSKRPSKSEIARLWRIIIKIRRITPEAYPLKCGLPWSSRLRDTRRSILSNPSCSTESRPYASSEPRPRPPSVISAVTRAVIRSFISVPESGAA